MFPFTLYDEGSHILSIRAALWFGEVVLCSVVTIKVLLTVLGKTFAMVLLYHSSDRGWL